MSPAIRLESGIVGRKQQTQPPIPATAIREAFHVRQDGQIVRRSTGEIATFPSLKRASRWFGFTMLAAIRSSPPVVLRGR